MGGWILVADLVNRKREGKATYVATTSSIVRTLASV